MITPKEIDEHQFTVGMRGFDRDEVDNFLDLVSAAYRQALTELGEARAEIGRLKQSAQPAVEATGVLALAQRTFDQTVTEANDTAGRIVSQAEGAAAEIVKAAEDRGHALVGRLEDTRQQLEEKITLLRLTRASLRDQMKACLEASGEG